MIYVKLGRTGLDVSRICLGCMSYGNPAVKNQPWSLGEKESLPFFRQAIELNPAYWENWYYRARLYVQQHQAEKARSDLASLMKLPLDTFEAAPHPQLMKLARNGPHRFSPLCL